MNQDARFQSFKAFYLFYLAEHSHPANRLFHFVGSSLVLIILAWTLLTGSWWCLVLLPIVGYGFAWAGHAVFEKNKPATFQYPIYSFCADWVMFKDMLCGKVKFGNGRN